ESSCFAPRGAVSGAPGRGDFAPPFGEGVDMRTCRLLSLALAGLLAFAHVSRADDKPRAEKAFEPTALLRLAPLDSLIGDARYLAKQAQREDDLAEVEKVLKTFTGIDTKKPLGAYATLSGKLEQSQIMLLLPIADEKEFLAFLKDLKFDAEKGDDGVYKGRV